MAATGSWRGHARRMDRRRLIGTGAAAGAAAFLIACGGDDRQEGGGSSSTSIGERTPVTQGSAATQGETPKPGGQLREATITQAPHSSPYHPGADPSYVNFFRRVYGYYDYLWTHKSVNSADRLQLMAAQSFEQVDPQSVVVKLKPSKFHNRAPANGRDVTAEDVAATIQFLTKPPATGGLFLQSGKDFKSVTPVDASTLRFEMFGPRAFFFEELEGGINSGKPIVPKEMLDEKILKESIPVGSGPYEYKAHTQGSSEEVKRFDGYRERERPFISERKLTFVPDTAAQEEAFRSGQIDIMAEAFESVKQKDAVARDLGTKIVVHSRPSTSGMAVIVNITRDPWKDIRVREALHRAIDVDRIINTVYFGDAERAWYFSKARFDRTPIGFDGVKQYVGYDPKKASDLLKASGIDLNKEYEFMVPVEAQTWVDSGRLMAEDLAKVGLKTRINPVVRNIYLQRAGPKPGDFDISMSVLLDYRHATSNSGSFWNSNALNDPEIDAMVDTIFETVDNQQRMKLSQEFEVTLAKKYANFVPILSTMTHYAWYSYLKGFDTDFHPTVGLQTKRFMDK
jgi:peptide/nickel transport system substrate-binding protein